MITDKLGPYGAAKREVMPGVEHRQHKGLNNRAENSHQSTRRRERIMEALQIRATRSAISFSPARSTISFFAHPKLPLKIIASGATWLSRFGPIFQTSAPQHEAKRRSAFAFLHFYKLTARHDHGQPTQLRLNSSEPGRNCNVGLQDLHWLTGS
jgi:hypothetical protein